MYDKSSVGNFVHFVSIAGRLEQDCLSERSERVCRETLPDRRRSKMDKITVNAFIHVITLSAPIELNPNIETESSWISILW